MRWIDDRYQPLKMLGGTLSAQVYLVRDLVTGRTRVLKGIEGPIDGPDGLLLRREFELLAGVRHPRVVRVHDLGLQAPSDPVDSHPHLYFTLDYVPGNSFRFIQTAPLLARLEQFAELVDAVAGVHAHGLRCGDLKPENILLGPDGVQLIDFGLTREAESLDVGRIPTGTLPYMAPELLKGQAADTRADLFSLGALLFELLTGAPPFPHAETPSIRLQAWSTWGGSCRSLLSLELQASLPESLIALLDRLLCVTPADRPADTRFIFQALEAAGLVNATLRAVHPRVLAEHPFVGREQELEVLQNHYRRTSLGGGYLRVTGPRGIGKSRLLAELAMVLLFPSQGRLLRLTADELPTSARGLLADWLAETHPVPDDAPPWLARLERFRLEALNGSGPPPALLFDGVDIGSPIVRPGMWVCQVLPGPLEDQPPTVDTLRLEGLPEAAVRGMVEQASGLVRAPETIARFHHFSEGNPAILRAVLLHPAEMADPSRELMTLLAPLAEGELEPLSVGAREAGRCAALLREPLSLEVLGGLLEVSREEVTGRLQQLVAAGVLQAEREGGAGFVFRRPMARAVLAGELEASRREELHRRAGRLLERRLQLGGQVPNAALAHHFDQAGEPEKARRYLARALRDAMQIGALLEAHDLCQRLLVRLPDGDPERTRIHSELGDLNMSLQRFAQAEEGYTAALAGLEVEGEDDALITQLRLDLLGRLARALEDQGKFSEARRRLEQAVALIESGVSGIEPDLPDYGRIALALARVYHREGRLEEARTALARGMQTLERHQRTGDLVEALVLEGLLRMDVGELEAAAGIFSRALELATTAGLTAGRMRALHNLHILEKRRGDLHAAVDYLKRALELAESLGDVARLGAGYNNLGQLQKRLGDSRRALQSYRRAARTFERVGDRAGLVTVHYSQAELLRERGEYGRALEQLEAAESLANALGGGFREQALQRTRLVRGEVLLALGRLEEAQPLLEQCQREAEARGDREATLAVEVGLAEIWLAKGETAEVERRCIELAKRVTPGHIDAPLFGLLTRLHHHLGHHYGAAYVEQCRARGHEVLGSALLETSVARFPAQGAEGLRRSLEEAVRLLDLSGRGQLAARARGLLQDLGAGIDERLELLKGVLDVLQNLGDRKQVLAHLVSLAARVLRAERGLLLYRRTAGDLVDFTVLHGMNLGEAQRVSGEIIRRVSVNREPVMVADALEEPSLIGSASIQDLQIRSVLGLLIDRDEQGMWILYLDHRQLAGVFSAESRPLLERLSQLAAGLLREIRFRETLLARVEAPEHNGRRYGMVGRSQAIERVRDYIDNLGHLKLHNENLLFIGESGTGKELVARAVHQVVRAGRDIPFIAQSCADIPAELIESTLFGHRRGAFTGAREDRPGIFELASGGVLFLDEIGELPLNLQASLLRVLEERTISRIGEPERPRALTLIVVCATNRDLSREVEAGRFRRDLFHRLNQVFRLPPLRERREDILPLLRHFMAQVEDFNSLGPEEVFAPEVLLWFHEHPWPGNIRELKNIVEAIPVRIKARRRMMVELEDLGVRSAERSPHQPSLAPELSFETRETLKDFTERIEAGYIRRAMDQCDWDITAASARLGLTYQGLRKRLLKYEWMNEVERRRH